MDTINTGSSTVSNAINTTVNIPDYAQYCPNRLPCGYCKLIYTMCFLQRTGTPTITWTGTTPSVTCDNLAELRKEMS